MWTTFPVPFQYRPSPSRLQWPRCSLHCVAAGACVPCLCLWTSSSFSVAYLILCVASNANIAGLVDMCQAQPTMRCKQWGGGPLRRRCGVSRRLVPGSACAPLTSFLCVGDAAEYIKRVKAGFSTPIHSRPARHGAPQPRSWLAGSRAYCYNCRSARRSPQAVPRVPGPARAVRWEGWGAWLPTRVEPGSAPRQPARPLAASACLPAAHRLRHRPPAGRAQRSSPDALLPRSAAPSCCGTLMCEYHRTCPCCSR